MKLIDVKLARLHEPILVGGCNLTKLLDVSKRTGLILKVDTDKHALYVQYKGETSVEVTNLAGYVPVNAKDLGLEPQETPPAPEPRVKTKGAAMTKGAPFTAQVETPHGLTRSKL